MVSPCKAKAPPPLPQRGRSVKGKGLDTRLSGGGLFYKMAEPREERKTEKTGSNFVHVMAYL